MIISAAAAAATSSRDLVIITLPASGAEPAVTIRLSTGTVPAIEGNTYEPKLRSMPQITQSDGGDADGGDFTIENQSNTYGQAFLNTDRALDGAEVVILRAYLLANGTWEIRNPATNDPYELGRGILTVEPIDENFVKCIFTAYTSDATLEVGGEPITQNCNKIFNFNGNHPLGGECGWKVSQGGDPAFCDYSFTSAQGCKGHNNQARFGGVQPLMPNAGAAVGTGPGNVPLIPIIPLGGYGDGSEPRSPNPDFDIDTRRPFMNPVGNNF